MVIQDATDVGALIKGLGGWNVGNLREGLVDNGRSNSQAEKSVLPRAQDGLSLDILKIFPEGFNSLRGIYGSICKARPQPAQHIIACHR